VESSALGELSLPWWIQRHFSLAWKRVDSLLEKSLEIVWNDGFPDQFPDCIEGMYVFYLTIFFPSNFRLKIPG
jgi:hypothetical protein